MQSSTITEAAAAKAIAPVFCRRLLLSWQLSASNAAKTMHDNIGPSKTGMEIPRSFY